MSLRRTLLTLLFALVLAGSGGASALAQTCSAPCDPPDRCVWEDASHTRGVCESADIVVTGQRPSSGTFADLVNNSIVPLIDGALVPLLYALAFLFFLFGVAQFFFSYSEEKRKEGKAFALWGLLGLFVLFSVWGLVRLFLSILTG